MKNLPILSFIAGLLAAAGVSRGDALTVNSILQTMTPDDYFQIANQPINEAEYALAAVLPSELRATYEAKSGSIKVITTPAGETGMDSPYIPVGGMEVDGDSKPIAKWTATSLLSEQTQREIQQMLINIRAGVIAGNSLDYLRNVVLNWLRKVISQSFDDRVELMRAEVLQTGQLVLKGMTLQYKVPAGNFFAARSGADSYVGTTSKFWVDMRAADTRLRTTRARMMSMATLHAIIDNPANNMAVVGETISPEGNVKVVQVRRTVNNGQSFSADVRDGYTLVGYGRSVKIKAAGPGFIDQQVLTDGKIIVVGSNDIQLIGTDGTIVQRPGLGRVHVGPTVEGNGRPGVWLNAYTPQNRPMNAVAEGAMNGVPIYDAPERLVVLTTDVQ